MSIDATNLTYAADDVDKWKNGANPVKVNTALDQITNSVIWVVTEVKTANYTAKDREIVRIDPS